MCAVYLFRFFYQTIMVRLYSYTCAFCYPLLDYACCDHVYVRLSPIECFCISACQHSYRYSFVRKLLKNQSVETWCSSVSFSIYDVIIFVQVYTFVTEHHSIAVKINKFRKRCLCLSPFYRLIFLPQWIIMRLQFSCSSNVCNDVERTT